MARAGYDPQAAVDFWKRVFEEEGDSAWLEFLSTHPADKKRIEHLQEECNLLKNGTDFPSSQ